MATIFCVEDDAGIREIEIYTLKSTGFTARGFADGAAFFETLAKEKPSLVILDVMLPGEDGVEILKRLKAAPATCDIPVIMATAKGMEYDRVQSLDLGADDYIEKPFGTSELLARIRTAIRHTRTPLDNNEIAQSGKFTVKDLTIDYDKHQVLINGENAHLTQNEFKIVALLGKCAGKVLTYDFIMRELWGPQSKGNNQILRVNMANIRRKIEANPAEPQYIFTEVGVGYRMIEGTE